MLQINVLSVQALKEKQFVAYMMFVRNAVADHEIIRQWFPFYVNKFLAAYEALDEAFLQFDIDACTSAVQNADAARDKAFRKMRDSIKWFITYPESKAKTQAAEELMRIIELYGGIYIPSQGQTAKTATITNLVDDFETKCPSEVELLGVGSVVEELKEAQVVFDQKYMARAVCESEFAKGAMADARKNATDAYRLLVDAVNVKVYEDTDGQLTDFINLLNVEIGRNRTYTGQGQVGSNSGSGSDSEEGEARLKTATFHFLNGDQVKLRVEVGTVLAAPSNTEGYMWKPEVPELMPAKNLTFREVPIEERKATATFHFFDHTEEEIKQVVGSALTAPENTEGYYWDPEVPATMPEEDTSYYELPVEQEEGGEGQEEEEYTVTYHNDNGEVIATQRYKVGQTIVPPTPPAGFEWGYLPIVMPARNLNIYPIDPETGA